MFRICCWKSNNIVLQLVQIIFAGRFVWITPPQNVLEIPDGFAAVSGSRQTPEAV